MAKPFLLMFSSSLYVMLLLLIQHPTLSLSKTLQSDIEALRSFRQSIDPNSISSTSFVHTWNFEASDPCENAGQHFLGILCTIPENNNSTSRISELNLEGDGLEGFLTPTLGNLNELTFLNLRKNRFRGPIPDSITKLTKITWLFLSENFLSGTIPNRFNNLKRLEAIDLSRNRLSGSIPESMSDLRGLTQLILKDNEFSGRIPDLTSLWKLNMLDLRLNQLYGNLPGFPRNLKSMFLGQNQLSGHITSINQLIHLKELDLSNNRFSGTINQAILELPEVSTIDVSGNRFTEMEVARMSKNQSSQLREVNAENNWIRGHLPRNLVTYVNLIDVNLRNNMFSGEIPVEYGERVGNGSWRSLFLDHNLLEGNVPTGFKNGGRIRGSLSRNCLNCPLSIPMCRGGQKSASECVGHRNRHG